METEADGEDCGGPEPARNSDPERNLQSETEDNEKDDIFCSFSDIQQLVVVKEEVPPEQQEWISSLDPEPPRHIKEEQEELWSSREGEQLRGLEEADITKFTFTPVPVKSEDDEEKPQSSQLHRRQTEHLETEADGEDYGGPEPARNSDPERHLQPETEDNPGDSSEPDTDDRADWKKTREPGSNSLRNKQETTSSSWWWLKKRFPLSSRGGAPVWPRKTQSPPHTLKRNRRNSGAVRRESSFEGWRRLISPSSHSILSM
nr:uncharacterized protein LOC117441594 [Pseudochaenichthys georgianus]